MFVRPIQRACQGRGRACRLAVVAIVLFTAIAASAWGQFRVPIPVEPIVPPPMPIPHIPVPPTVPVPNPGPDAPSQRKPYYKSPPMTASDWICIAALFTAIGSLCALATFPLWTKRRRIYHIRIVATPPGEPPECVRRSWIGVVLPLARGEIGVARRLPAVGVISRESQEPVLGYVVEGRAAIRALEKIDPQAAAWWCENIPEIRRHDYRFGFPADVCERIYTKRSSR